MNSFVMRYWRGEYSLPISYWVVNVVLAIIITAAAGALTIYLTNDESFSPVRHLIWLSLLYFFVVTASIWQWVGLYRSAWKYIADPATLSGWGYAALVMLCLGIFRSIPVVLTDYLPTLSEYVDMAFRDDPSLPAFQISKTSDGEEISLLGGIKAGLLEELKETLERSPNVKTIELDSIGGRMHVARDLYNLIRESGLNTVVNNECLSACTLAFAAGQQRWLGPFGQLGFHQASFAGVDGGESQRIQLNHWQEIAATQEINFDIIRKHASTPNSEMSFPTRTELLDSNLVTSGQSKAKSTATSYEQSMQADFESLRATLPTQINQYTTMVAVNLVGVTHEYTYVLSDEYVSMLTGIDSPALVGLFQEEQCKVSGAKEQMALGIKFKYTYLREENKDSFVSYELVCEQ